MALSDNPELGGLLGYWQWDMDRDLAFADETGAFLLGLDPAATRRGIPSADYMVNLDPGDQAHFAVSRATWLASGGRLAPNAVQFRVLDPKTRAVQRMVLIRVLRESAARTLYGVTIDITESPPRATDLTFDAVDGMLASVQDWLGRQADSGAALYAAAMLAESLKRLRSQSLDVARLYPEGPSSHSS